MIRMSFLAVVAVGVAWASPASSFNENEISGPVSGHALAMQDQSDMPFPRLMNSIFGKPSAQPRRERRYVRLRSTNRNQPSTHSTYQPRYTTSPRVRTTTRTRNVVHSRAARPATRQMDPRFEKRIVDYSGSEKPGTIIIKTGERHLYYVLGNGKAWRYGVGVGRAGFEWSGSNKISRKAEWPAWRPPEEMKRRQPGLPDYMSGGPRNPLGARALYIGSTLYRIHGSNEPWTIGHAVSSGCIRMRNEDVIHLYEQVRVGAKVIVI